jgi:hypothetical protein
MNNFIQRKLRMAVAMTGLILLSACASVAPGGNMNMAHHCAMCSCCAHMSEKDGCACCKGHTCPPMKDGKGACCNDASGKPMMCKPK